MRESDIQDCPLSFDPDEMASVCAIHFDIEDSLVSFQASDGIYILSHWRGKEFDRKLLIELRDVRLRHLIVAVISALTKKKFSRQPTSNANNEYWHVE